MNVFDLFAKITLDTVDYEKQLDSANQKTTSLGDKLKSGLATAGKVAAAGIAAATAAVGALSKASINGYAEYEQLVGGIETLFGAGGQSLEEYARSVGKTTDEAAAKYQELMEVQETALRNADNAYRTAGLSANDYMETITGFAASLKQSLGEEYSWQMANIADMAISDMADNANKMGTTMDSIQNAYQGFAKQNYTMLDNLKLGYGGTKEEMQRLLSDAEALEGYMEGSFDISNFSDIVEAIHIIQENMGITGTTAKEAASTIQGSAASMKAAWQNLVTGIGNENADLETLIGNFIGSVEVAAGNIIPRLTQILSGMGQAVQQVAPILAEQVPVLVTSALPSMVSAGAQLLAGLITGIIAAVPDLAAAVPEIINSVVTSIQDNLPTILDAGGELLTIFQTGIISKVPEMIEDLPEIIDGILNFVTENLPSVLDKGAELLENFAFGILEYIPQLVAQLPQVIQSITKFITDNLPLILEKGGELLGQLIMGILGAIPEIAVQLPAVITAIVDALNKGWDLIKDAGGYLLEGLWDGIWDKVGWLKEKVSGVVDTIKGWFTGEEGFNEHSPSKWANQVFRYVMEGGGEGLEQGLPGLMRDVADVADKVKGGMDIGTANVDFAASGVGQSSAAIVNGITGGSTDGSGTISLTINLLTGEARPFAQWILPDLIQAADAAGTPIASGQYA